MVSCKKHSLGHTDNSNNYGHSLLSFMELASNKVQTALEKPNSFKRNINHRRFLQKQFKALVKSPAKALSRKQIHLAEQRKTQEIEYQSSKKNQMLLSSVNVGQFQFSPVQRYFPTQDIPETFTQPFAMSGNICEKSHCKYSGVSKSNFCSTLPELVVEEDAFLSGEELTQAIELKDLFKPETDLTQYLNIRDSLEFLASNKTNPDFDNWICHEFSAKDNMF